MKTLITGGLGLIGHNVAHKLAEQGHHAIVLDNKTTYGIIPQAEMDYLHTERSKKLSKCSVRFGDMATEDFETTVSLYKPDAVIHLASFPRQKVVNANPQLGARWMVEGLLNVLETCVKYNVPKFVYASSSMVYGDFNHSITEEEPCKPQGQYGIMKYMGEKLVQDYERKGLLKAIIIRPSAVYGPLDVEDRVISKFILTAMRGGVLKVKGQNEMLDFTYVDDAADGIVTATLTDDAYGQTFNITKGASTTLYQAAQLAVDIVGKGTIVVEDRDQDFPSRAALNISKARRVFDFDPKVDVAQGFVKYYEWLSKSTYWSEVLKNRQ